MSPETRVQRLFGRRRPPRLQRVFQTYSSPIYFVTICVRNRRARLDTVAVRDALTSFAERGFRDRNIAVGRYIIMPDHVHLFVRLPYDERLTQWARLLKHALGRALRVPGLGSCIWQRGFFDHMLRGADSYSEKWGYVYRNPVRAGLVSRPEDWPFQGEIHRIAF